MIKKPEKELKELNTKRNKLSKFLSKQNKKTLSANQLRLLKEQKQAMDKYAKVLKLRIEDLKEAK
ncbi:crAss001_48 related protein [Lactobacillus gasseri]